MRDCLILEDVSSSLSEYGLRSCMLEDAASIKYIDWTSIQDIGYTDSK